MLKRLTEADCRLAMRDGDFSPELLGGADTVVLALTQSWCPQWTRMRPWLEELAADPAVTCHYVEYDLEPFFEDFRAFKESVYRNEEVPYYRYYRKGLLVKESNYLDRASFRRLALPQAD